MATINGLPVFEARADDIWETGITAVSFVDEPAVMSNFQTFAKEEEQKKQYFAVQDEEHRMVLGVLMRADFPIYRIGENGEGFYLVYKRDTLEKMAQGVMMMGTHNNTNMMHIAGFVDGAYPVQVFIKDIARGVSPAGFEDIADGSLFGVYHIENDNLWARIKDGTFKGFSIEGYFDIVPESNQEYADKVVEDAKGKFSKIHNKMATFNRFLKKLLCEFGKVTTDKGLLSWASESELKVGDEVKVVADDGTESAAPDGDYTTETQVITVADGKVAEIKDIETGSKQKNAEEVESLIEDVKKLREEVNELFKLVDSLAKNAGLTRDDLENMQKMSAEEQTAFLQEKRQQMSREAVKAADVKGEDAPQRNTLAMAREALRKK